MSIARAKIHAPPTLHALRRRRASLLALAALALALAGCGGGSAGGPPPVVDPDPPTSLVYDEPDVLYRTEAAIQPNLPTVTGGAPETYAVAPSLPPGLALDVATGVLSGTPTLPQEASDYLVTAANTAGQTSAVLRIEVRWPPSKSLVVEEEIDDADLRHFLLRTHWGVRQGNYDALVGIGLEPYVDAMLDFPPVGSTVHEQQADAFLLRATDPPGQEGMFPTRGQLVQWWLTLMILNPNTFQEVLAFHWHDHFATSSEVLGNGSTYWMKNHVNLFRGQGAGELKSLILDVSRDWAMLRWLDGTANTGFAPNENFAREYCELFCLGIDNGYTEIDIQEAARAFTGYRQVTLDADTGLLGVTFDSRRHDPGSKTIFGRTIPGQNAGDDYEAVVDITVEERDVAGWICRSLVERFCMEDPPDELIEQLAAELENAGYELAPVLKTLFLSEAFYSAEARGGYVRSPVEMAIGFINATGLVIHPRELATRLGNLGQAPTLPPTVNGWPTGQLWLAAQGMIDRTNFLNSCVTNRFFQTNLGIDVADLLPASNATADETVDALTLRLGLAPTPTQRTVYVDYMNTERLPDGTVVASPFDATNPVHIDDRLRGLLYILGQHPVYQTR